MLGRERNPQTTWAPDSRRATGHAARRGGAGGLRTGERAACRAGPGARAPVARRRRRAGQEPAPRPRQPRHRRSRRSSRSRSATRCPVGSTRRSTSPRPRGSIRSMAWTPSCSWAAPARARRKRWSAVTCDSPPPARSPCRSCRGRSWSTSPAARTTSSARSTRRPSTRAWRTCSGKTVGANGPYDASHLAIRVALARLGWDPDHDVVYSFLGGQRELVAGMLQGVIAAGDISPPTSLEARNAGLHELLDVASSSCRSSRTPSARRAPTCAITPSWCAASCAPTSRASRWRRRSPTRAMAAIGKYTKSRRPGRAPRGVRHLRNVWERVPRLTLEALQGQLDALALQVPEARDARPEQFLDMSSAGRARAFGLRGQPVPLARAACSPRWSAPGLLAHPGSGSHTNRRTRPLRRAKPGTNHDRVPARISSRLARRGRRSRPRRRSARRARCRRRLARAPAAAPRRGRAGRSAAPPRRARCWPGGGSDRERPGRDVELNQAHAFAQTLPVLLERIDGALVGNRQELPRPTGERRPVQGDTRVAGSDDAHLVEGRGSAGRRREHVDRVAVAPRGRAPFGTGRAGDAEPHAGAVVHEQAVPAEGPRRADGAAQLDVVAGATSSRDGPAPLGL